MLAVVPRDGRVRHRRRRLPRPVHPLVSRRARHELRAPVPYGRSRLPRRGDLPGCLRRPRVRVCHVPAVCGDGGLDLIGGEICDDGNTQSGDGCSADCLTPELGPLCDVSGALPECTAVAGDTSEGPSGYPSQCDPFIGTRVSTYSYVAPGPGQVRLTLDSAEDLRLSVYAECDDPATELGCQSEGDYDELIVDLDAAPAGPLLVIVRGASPIHEGAFTIHAEFTPAVCGDGVAVGPEECDDGNTTSGDGCSGDCLTVEWANVCAALPALSTSAVNTGTTAGAASLFETGSLCAVGPGGRERAYSFVAPSDGTLDLTPPSPNQTSPSSSRTAAARAASTSGSAAAAAPSPAARRPRARSFRGSGRHRHRRRVDRRGGGALRADGDLHAVILGASPSRRTRRARAFPFRRVTNPLPP
ncbi:MAG: DUF4215 domain-containing protein [Polyangiaceae bacterium]|nr:DUF4215 domain-containing protein [Polyangiaceae bacterium]